MMKFPGSNWWSFDFHNHTPASSDYDASERSNLTARDWLLAYMQSNVDCVVITDHNSGGWIDSLKQELTTMAGEQPRHTGYRELCLFPGVELTSSEGIHVLAVFGPEECAAKIHALLALAKYNNDTNNAHGMCEEGASAICNHIHQTGGVAIFAHAEEINGIFHGVVDSVGQFQPTRSARSIDQLLDKADALEVRDENAPAILYFEEKLRGRAIVDGSDAHRTNRAGVRSVWLKMAQPSIEGLKLALLDPASSLLRTDNKPSAPLHRISSLRIEQLHLRRQPLDIMFSPWFNAIIGGRGSGKSTLLEALRLSLARESDINELSADSDVRRAFDRFRQVGGVRGNAGMVRQDTVLDVTVEKVDLASNSKESYILTWMPNLFKAKRLNESGAWEETGLTAKQAAKLFPVKVFSQKQIFELAEFPSALLSYIDRAPEVAFQDWHDKNESLRRDLRDLRTSERSLLQAIERKAQLETEFKEVSRKTTAYQQSSVAQQVKVFRENQLARDAIESFLKSAAFPIDTLDQAFEKANPYETIQLENVTLQNPDPATLLQVSRALIEDLKAQYEVMRQSAHAMRQKIDAFQDDPITISFLKEVDSAMAAYRQEVERLKADGIGTAQEAEAALKRKQELETALNLIAVQERQLVEIQQRIFKAYAALKLHRRKLTRLRQEFVNSVLSNNNSLRITIDGQSDVQQSIEEFRSILRLQEGTFIDDVYSVDEESNQPMGLLGRLICDGIHDATHKRVTGLKLGILDRSGSILGQTVHGRLVTALRRLDADDDAALLEWFPEDLVTVEFKRSESADFQSLERASAGQKTSAILSFLLAHGDEPLLLDQPEDDLDNALVSKLVVQQIRDNKSRRQIIVVTHNPNIVVNGDAEFVLPMSFAAGQIQLNDAGGLQERVVRQQICDIMEGGRNAFRQRYKRILEDLDATN